jgi:hypothetical protein
MPTKLTPVEQMYGIWIAAQDLLIKLAKLSKRPEFPFKFTVTIQMYPKTGNYENGQKVCAGALLSYHPGANDFISQVAWEDGLSWKSKEQAFEIAGQEHELDVTIFKVK